MSPLWFMKKSLFNTGDLINNESTLIHEKKSLFNTGDLINNESTLIHEKNHCLIQETW